MSSQNAISVSLPGTRKALALPLVFTSLVVALGFLYPNTRTNPHMMWTYIGVGCMLVCWVIALFLRPMHSEGLKWDYYPIRAHYVQALVQLPIYVYWGWYWRNVYAETPLILSQVAYVYALDSLLTWTRGRAWRFGFGPWPIIFSSNLFIWFREDWYYYQFVLISLGVFGKQFVVWKRDGVLRHIFNPSVFGLSVVSIVLILTGTTDHTWGSEIAATQARPPHIYMEIFLGGLIVQYLFSVTLLTFSAAAALAVLSLLYTKITGVYLFFDANIPIAVFLGLHLLMTDPATTPRGSFGKIVFGAMYGAGVFVADLFFAAYSIPGFYDKLVMVPVLNLMVPALDRAARWSFAAKFGSWENFVGAYKANMVFIGGWAAFFMLMWTTNFVEGPHPGKSIAFWEKAAEQKRPHAVRNLCILLKELEERGLADPSAGIGIADNGHMSSQEALGIMCDQAGSVYEEGKFIPANPAKAAYYFEKGCEFGNTEACVHLCIEYFHTNTADAQVDITRALSTLENSGAASKDGRACTILGFASNSGRGMPMDKAKARHWYEQGAALGEVAAWKALAQMQIAGEGGPADHASAAAWLQKAADVQDGMSCLYLARLYHNGDGVTHDEQKALALLKKACDLGVEPACLLLRQTQPHLSLGQ